MPAERVLCLRHGLTKVELQLVLARGLQVVYVVHVTANTLLFHKLACVCVAQDVLLLLIQIMQLLLHMLEGAEFPIGHLAVRYVAAAGSANVVRHHPSTVHVTRQVVFEFREGTYEVRTHGRRLLDLGTQSIIR